MHPSDRSDRSIFPRAADSRLVAARWTPTLLAALIAGCTPASEDDPALPFDTVDVHPPYRAPLVADGPRVLCVTAHPDDEIAFGATLFKIATALGGHTELAILTNGEGGYKYSTLAELLYGVEITDPEVGRRELPKIRRAEQIAAASVLGISRVHFFGQTDHRYTTDPNEVLAADAGVWDLELVRSGLRRLLDEGRFDFVFTHLPSPTTHGHHKAATILALEAVEAMPKEKRPVVLGAFGGRDDEPRPRIPDQLPGFPVTRFLQDGDPWTFRRDAEFGFKNRLDYRIVIKWAVTCHKSQGTYQSFTHDWQSENFRAYALDVPDRDARAQALFEQLALPQFTTPVYDEAGNRTGVLAPGVPPPTPAPSPEDTDPIDPKPSEEDPGAGASAPGSGR
jgi:LmbE family N-acetylglucosaminyl deacetylase